ncbi:MAG: phosphate acyltransferase [Calditrichota bacterium]
MNFTDLLKRLDSQKPGRIAAAGVSSEDKKLLEAWRKRGWTVEYFDGELAEAITAATDAAMKGNTDLLFCGGTEHLKIVRGLVSALDQAAPQKYDTVSIMQAMEVPAYPKLMWVGYTPLAQYQSIPAAVKSVQTMLKALADLGEPEARVALLSCVELVSPGVSSTIWEGTLGHMSARGQFGKAKVDGPLGFDLAVSPEAVKDKGVRTDINGEADLLIPPDLNSYATLVDAIQLTGEHKSAGIIIGGPVPVAISPDHNMKHTELSMQIASLLR